MAVSVPHALYDPGITHKLERSSEQHCWLYDGLPTRWSDEADATTVKMWIVGRYGNIRLQLIIG
jgi:hypothetical protein